MGPGQAITRGPDEPVIPIRRPDDRDANDAVIRMSAQVTAEDIAICESVQRNLESGTYDTGWLSPKHEGGVAAFQRWVRETIDS